MTRGAAGTSLRGLATRTRLTYEHLGLRALLYRALTFPLRLTPLRLPLGVGRHEEQYRYDARRWQRRHGPPLEIWRPGAPLAAPPGHDLATVEDPATVAILQYTAHVTAPAPAAGGTVIAEDGTIAAAGLCRDHREPARLVGRFAGRPADHGPAQVEGPILAPAAECALVTAAALARHGQGASSIEELCARAGASHHVPLATVRGAHRPAPVVPPQPRNVRTPDGRLRVVYVTQETTVGGGHRDVFEHLNRLHARGHEVALYSLGPQPDWFPLAVQVRTFAGWPELTAALAPLEALKVATWWRSGLPVWRASLGAGVPVYFVQDIETSYYPDEPRLRDQVLASYRNEFRYMTISSWNRDRLDELGLDAELIPPGIDLETFRPLEEIERREDLLVAVGRRHHLKNLDLTLDAWRRLGDRRPELAMFGIEPELGLEHGARYLEAPSDEQVNELFNEAAIFIQTSRHEGFALPPLEAMAAGAAVVCTDAHGNRDFCIDGENCLMPDADPASVASALERLLDDPPLRRRLGEAGIRTAQAYAWERRVDALEAFLERLAGGDGRTG